jgi:hypothetical protein
MTDEPKMRDPRLRDITVESDWFTTLLATALFVVSGLLLFREVHRFFWGQLSGVARSEGGFWNIWNKVFEAIAGVGCFMTAFTFSKKSVKIALVLMGIDLAVFAPLSCFHVSPYLRHFTALTGSVVRQGALAIFCVTLATGLGSVVRWARPSEPPRGEE